MLILLSMSALDPCPMLHAHAFDRVFRFLHVMQPAHRVHKRCQNFMQTLEALVKPSPSHARALMPSGDLGQDGIGKHRR